MMKSNDRASKTVDVTKSMHANADPRSAATSPPAPVETPEPVGEHPSDKPKPARFDFAAANQAHWKSMSSLRGKNAGPANKGPTRR